MSTRDTLRKFVLETFLFTSDDGALTDDDSFLDKGIIDSTGILELIMFLEEQYGISVAEEEMLPENFDSVTSLERFVERKRS